MIIKIINFVIGFYQNFLSFDKGILAILAPGGACKHPLSCSEYTRQSVVKHGVIFGVWLGIKRIWSCR